MSEYVSEVNMGQRPLFSLGKAPLLGRLDVELTERCNNRCIHCCINQPLDDPESRHYELSTSAVRGILEQAVDLLSVTELRPTPLLSAGPLLFARMLPSLSMLRILNGL